MFAYETDETELIKIEIGYCWTSLYSMLIFQLNNNFEKTKSDGIEIQWHQGKCPWQIRDQNHQIVNCMSYPSMSLLSYTLWRADWK